MSTDLQLENNTIINERFSFEIFDHPMKPFGMRYWEGRDFSLTKEGFDHYSPHQCSWIRDQEYLVDFKYYENLHHLAQNNRENYLHIFPKVR